MKTAARKLLTLCFLNEFSVSPKFLTALFLIFSTSAFADSGITYHGKILKPDGVTPVSSATTQFRIQVRTPGTGNCLLWEEQQTKDLSSSAGVFSITIADSSEPSLIANTLPYTLERTFSNRTNFTGLTGCSSGSTYNPNPTDGRILVVFFRENPTDPWEQMPVTKVNFVPLALNSVQLEGYAANEFLKIDPLSAYTPLTAANVNTLVDIIAGTSNQYLKPATAFSGDVSGTYNATSVDKIKGISVVGAPANGQVLKYNGTNWVPAADDNNASPADASYTVKGVVQINTDLATSGLFIAGGVLALPNVITAGGPTGNAQTVPVITYDQKGRLTAVSTATIDDTTKLPLAGGTMTGNINMGGHDITNAANVAATNVSVRNVVLNDNDTNTVTIKTPADIAANYSLTLPVNDGASGEVLSTDGNGVLSWVSASAGSVTNVSSANNYLTVTNPNTTPVLTVNVGTVANTVAAGDDARITGALQTATYDADVLPAASCTTSQTPYWNSIAGTWACQNINVAGTGAFVDGGNTFTATATLGTNSNHNLEIETNGTTKVTVTNSGNVGIGTTTPAAALEVSSSNNTISKVSGTNTGTSGTITGQLTNVTLSPNAANSASLYGNSITATYAPSSGGSSTVGGIIGINALAQVTGFNGGASYLYGGNFYANTAGQPANTVVGSASGGNAAAATTTLYGAWNTATAFNSPVTNAYGVYGSSLADSSSNITNSYGGYFKTYTGTILSPTVTNAYGLYSEVLKSNGTVTNGYGLYTGNIQATNKFSIYASDSTAPSYFAGNVGIGTTNPSTKLDVAGGIKIGTEASACAAGLAGSLRYNGGSVEYCNGTSWQAFGVSGAGLTSLGGQTGNTQTFAAGSAGNSPAISSAANVHTLNVPLASAGASVTSGTISNAEYVALNAKLTSPLTTKGDILTRDGTTHVRVPVGTNGQVLMADSAQSSGIKWGDAGTVTSVTSANNYVTVTNTTTTPLITANVGTAANTLAAGDDSRITGALQTTVYDADVLPAASCTTSQTPYWSTVAGTWLCQNINVASTGAFVDGGNTFAATATIGTNSNHNLEIETNGTTKMTIGANGNVGIGTAPSAYKLDVNGIMKLSGRLETSDYVVANSQNDGGVSNPFVAANFGQANGTGSELLFESYNNGYGSLVDSAAVTGILVDGTNGAERGDLLLKTLKNGTTTEKLRITGNGDVGIGTNNPGAKLDITAAANSIALKSTGYSLTGANAQSLVDLSGTWNTTGTPTLLKANVTDTASNASSLLMDLQVGGVSKFKVDKTGKITGDGSGLTNISGSISGLTTNTLPIATSATTLGNSMLSQNSGNVIVSGGNRAITSELANDLALSGNLGSGGILTLGWNGRIQAMTNGGNGFEVMDGGNANLKINSGNVSIWNLATNYATNNNLTLSPSLGAGNFIISGTKVGIGTTSPTAKLNVDQTVTAISGETAVVQNTAVYQAPSATAGNNGGNGVKNDVTYQGTNSFNNWYNYGSKTTATVNMTAPAQMATINALSGMAYQAGDGMIVDMIGVQGTATKAYTGDVVRMYGVNALATNINATGSVTNAYGVYSNVTKPSGTITNAYGYYAGSVEGTNKWSFYASDATVPNFFAGNVGIGTGITAPNTAIDVNGAISQRGMAAPAVSPAGQGRMYFDSTSNTFKISQNGGAYGNLVTSSGSTGGYIRGGNSFGADSILGLNDSYSLSLYTAGSPNIVLNPSGASPSTVIYGRSASASALQVTQQNKFTSTSGTFSTASISSVADPTASSTGTYKALDVTNVYQAVTNSTTGDLIGINVGTDLQGNSSLGRNIGVKSNIQMSGGSNPTTTEAISFDAKITNSAATMTSAYGLKVENTSNANGGVIGSNYGVYVGSLIGTNKWSFYASDSTVPNFFAGNVGIGTGITAPNTALDVNGAVSQRGMAAPAVSPATQGRIYFDSTANKFKVSENGGAYVDLIGSGAVTGSGTTGKIPKWSSSSALTDSIMSENSSVLSIAGSINIPTTTSSNGQLKINNTKFLHAYGTNNIFLGPDSGNFSLTQANATSNIGIGSMTLTSVTTGSANIAIGTNSLVNTTTGASNIAIGVDSSDNANGINNVGIGSYTHGALTSGNNNTAIGQQASNAISTTSGSTSVGAFALQNSTGAGNLAIGYNAGNNITSGANNIIIGSVDAPSATASNQLNIGDLIYGSNGANKLVDVAGAFNLRGMAAPSVSSAGQGKMYFDSTSNTFKVSQNGGAYSDLATAASIGTSYVAKAGDTMTGALVNNTNSASTALAVTQSGSGYAATFMGGNVGIGKTNPGSKLDVTTTGTTAAQFIASGLNVTNYGIAAAATGAAAAGINYGGFFAASSGGAGNRAIATDQFSTPAGANNYSIYSGSQAQSYFAGDVGIGTTAPGAALDIQKAYTNVAGIAGISSAAGLVSSTGTYSVVGHQASVTPAVASGLANNGTFTGLLATAIRSSAVPADTGTANLDVGAYVMHGHEGAGITRTTTSSIGVLVEPHHQGGTITNSYGVYVSAPTLTGSTVTNYWGFYEADANAKNYFAGNVGVGGITPNTAMDLNGALSFRGMAAPAVAPAGQGRIYFDSTSNKFRASMNGGSYGDMLAQNAVSGTNGKIARFTASNAVGDSIMTESTGQVAVAGQIVSAGTPNQTSNAPAINFNNGNALYVTSACAAFTLSNMADGGSYMLTVKNTSGTCSFTSAGDTVRYAGGVSNVTITSHTIFSFLKQGTDVYVTWVTF